VLSLVHHEGSLSRAELTRRTGLNRSTIGDLVGELDALGLVRELVAESGAVGRPSPRVRVGDRAVVVTVNPDVDAVTVGIVGLGGQVVSHVRYPTGAPASAAVAADLVAAVVSGLRPGLHAQHVVLGLSVAVPGLVDRTTGTVTYAPHLGWRDAPLAAMLAERTGYPCRVANDAQAGLLAERWFGNGRGLTDVVYLNGSASGIGGAVLSGGRPVLGVRGYAGELGHLVVNPAGQDCHCGRDGCLETEVTRAGLLAALGRGDDAVEALSELGPRAADDQAVRTEVARQAGWLGQAVTDIVHAFNPQAILLGGFLAELYRAAPAGLDTAVAQAGFGPLTPGTTIGPAHLGTQLLSVGAAELVVDELLADPAQHGWSG
jgi:predicted NBD/HSP70 family sugar kinase